MSDVLVPTSPIRRATALIRWLGVARLRDSVLAPPLRHVRPRPRAGAGTPVDVRWLLRPHDRRLGEVLGPTLARALLAPPPGDGMPVRQILIQSRFLVVDGDPIGRLGAAIFDAPDAQLRFRDAKGTELTTPDADVGSNGAVSFDLTGTGTWNTGFFEATLRALEQDSDTTVLSAPRVVTTDDQPAEIKVILKQFRASMKNELKFSGTLARNTLKDFKQGAKAVGKAHKAGQITGANAARSGVELYLNSLASQGFWLPILQNQPAAQAIAGMDQAGLTDTDIPADVLPDGGSLYTRFLQRVSMNVTRSDLAFAKALGSFETKTTKLAGKQGEPLGTSLLMNGRDPALGVTLQITPTVISGLERGPGLQVGLIITAGGVPSTVTLGGLSDETAGSVDVDAVQVPGGTVVIGGLVVDDNTHRWKSPTTPLAGLPALGHLFRAKRPMITRSDVMPLVTPRLIIQEK